MLLTPKCFERKCIHFLGAKSLDLLDTERDEFVYCLAFPDGIPEDIAYGNNKHLVPIKNQSNTIVFEKEEKL